MNKPHLCPRCQSFTDEKYYCIPCRDSLKKPHVGSLKREVYYWNTNGRRA